SWRPSCTPRGSSRCACPSRRRPWPAARTAGRARWRSAEPSPRRPCPCRRSTRTGRAPRRGGSRGVVEVPCTRFTPTRRTGSSGVRVSSSAMALEPEPLWILGHNTNSIEEVHAALDRGANAVEIDVTAYAHDRDALCIDHAGLLGDDPGRASAPAFEPFLRALREVADRR